MAHKTVFDELRDGIVLTNLLCGKREMTISTMQKRLLKNQIVIMKAFLLIRDIHPYQ